MSKVYTLRAFRAKTKEAFDKADEEIDVIIERNNVRYILIHESYYNELLKSETPIVASPALKTALKELNKTTPIFDNFCKHGADPKFCKFAKPGKPCK